MEGRGGAFWYEVPHKPAMDWWPIFPLATLLLCCIYLSIYLSILLLPIVLHFMGGHF